MLLVVEAQELRAVRPMFQNEVVVGDNMLSAPIDVLLHPCRRPIRLQPLDGHVLEHVACSVAPVDRHWIIVFVSWFRLCRQAHLWPRPDELPVRDVEAAKEEVRVAFARRCLLFWCCL